MELNHEKRLKLGLSEEWEKMDVTEVHSGNVALEADVLEHDDEHDVSSQESGVVGTEHYFHDDLFQERALHYLQMKVNDQQQ